MFDDDGDDCIIVDINNNVMMNLLFVLFEKVFVIDVDNFVFFIVFLNIIMVIIVNVVFINGVVSNNYFGVDSCVYYG